MRTIRLVLLAVLFTCAVTVPNSAPLAQKVKPPKAEKKVQKKETVVYTTKTGSKYHSAGCQYLRRSSIEMTLSEAKEARLSPCSRCSPPK